MRNLKLTFFSLTPNEFALYLNCSSFLMVQIKRVSSTVYITALHVHIVIKLKDHCRGSSVVEGSDKKPQATGSFSIHRLTAH